MAVIAHAIFPIIAGVLLRIRKLAIATMVFFAVLPDFDVVLGFIFYGNFFAIHRGFTHSLVFALIPLFIYVLVPRKELLFGFAGALSHPIIDALDGQGAPLLWPFSNRMFALGLYPSPDIRDFAAFVLRPDAFLVDKVAVALLIGVLAYYAIAWWWNGPVGRGHKVADKEGKN